MFIYPNPATGRLCVRNDKIIAELEIMDITGKVISMTINKTGNKIIAVDISHLNSGIYFVRSVSGDKTCLNRFLKL